MTNTASLKFRLENNMALSSAAEGPKNCKNPSGSSEAGDSSTRSKCLRHRVHRLKPVRTKPNTRADALGTVSWTKYFLFICMFSVTLIICGTKHKISQQRRLVATSYEKVEHLEHLRGKLNGEFKRIVGGKFNKPQLIAYEIYSKLSKWEGHATKLVKTVNESDKTDAEKERLHSQIKDIQMSITVLKALISGIQKSASPPQNDFELMYQIINDWLVLPGPFRQGHKKAGNAGVLECIDKLLLKQIEWLFTEKQIQTVEHVSGILKAINKEKYLDVTSIEFTLKVLEMPDLAKLLASTPEIAGKSSFVDEFQSLLMKLKDGIKVAQMNADSDCIRRIANFMMVIARCSGIKMHDTLATEMCNTGQMVEKAIAFQQDSRKMLESLEKVQKESRSEFCGEHFNNIDLKSLESCKLAFRIYAYNWAYNTKGRCPEPRLLKSNFEDFLTNQKTREISKGLVGSWVSALKEVLDLDYPEYLADPNIAEPKFWTSDKATDDVARLEAKKLCIDAERLEQQKAEQKIAQRIAEKMKRMT